MSSRIKKDIRNSSAEWILAGLLVAMPAIILGTFGWLREEILPIHLAFLAIAASWLGAAIMGKDISLGMLSYALAHVECRNRIWNEKVKTVGTQVGCLLILSWACLMIVPKSGAATMATSPTWSTTLALAICSAGVGGGIFYSLILCSYQGAFWFTLLVPPALGVLLSTLPFLENRFLPTAAVLVLIYAIGLIWLSRKHFQEWEDLGPWGGEIWLSRFVKRSTSHQTKQKDRQYRPLIALALKEFNLQQFNLLITFGLIVTYIFALNLTGGNGKPTDTSMMLAGFTRVLLLAFLPLAMGAIAVAEERRLRLSEWQRTLPISTRFQWGIKLAVVYLVSLLGTAVIPLVIESTYHEGWNRLISIPSDLLVLLGVSIPLLATTIGIYTSSFCSNLLLAIGSSAAVILGIVAFYNAGIQFLGNEFGSGGMTPPQILFSIILLILLLPSLNLLSYFNAHSRLSTKGLIAWNGSGALAFALLTLSLTHWVYIRGWERFSYRPPTPGPSRLAANVTPTVIPGTWATVLAPNGTLWTSTYQSHQTTQDAASTPVMNQIGTDSDWSQASSGRRIIYLIKNDGRLFTALKWGQIAALSPTPFSDPKPETAWRKVVGGPVGHHTIGFKEDGTLWRWKESEDGSISEIEPFLSDRTWLSFARDFSFHVAVAADGTLWAWGINSGSSQGRLQNPLDAKISRERQALFPPQDTADLTDDFVQSLLEEHRALLERLKIDVTNLDDVSAPSRYSRARAEMEKIDETPYQLDTDQNWSTVEFTDRTVWHISRNDGNRTPSRILIATKNDGSRWTPNTLSFQAWALQQPGAEPLFVPFEPKLTLKRMKFGTTPSGEALLVLTETGELLERPIDLSESKREVPGVFIAGLQPISERKNWISFEREHYSTIALSNDGLLWQAGPYPLTGSPRRYLHHVIPPSKKLRPIFDFNTGRNL